MTSRGMGDRILGGVIFVSVVGAWLLGKRWGIETTELMAFAVPVVGALFLVGPINQAADASKAAAAQTNGVLDARIQSAVAKALANRDHARTRQSQGDISEAVPSPTDDTASSPSVDPMGYPAS